MQPQDAPPSATARPSPHPQPTPPYLVFTAHDTAQGLKTGLPRTFHFLQGMHDQANDMVNPLKIYQGLHEFGQHEAAIYISTRPPSTSPTPTDTPRTAMPSPASSDATPSTASTL